MCRVPTRAAGQPVLLVQLTDSHLFAAADGSLLGMRTADSLACVVAQVQAEQSRIDLLIASGDLSQDGSPASYRRFREATSRLQAAATRWIPGNHDALDALREAAEGTALLEPVVDLGDWRVILLDSTVPGSVPGFLAAGQLALLARALDEAAGRHCLVVLHHHPLPVGCAWLEPLGLRNADALFAMIDRHPQVRALLWGHIHQEYDQWRHGVRLLATPSTCVQFEPGSAQFQVGRQAPGYRWLQLAADGTLETGVSRLAGFAYQPDPGLEGY